MIFLIILLNLIMPINLENFQHVFFLIMLHESLPKINQYYLIKWWKNIQLQYTNKKQS
jgi:hypothetical protein